MILYSRFLTDQRRLNVAITRAKKALYIIGHLRTFQFNKHWSNLITHAEKQNVIVRVDKNMKECLSGIKANSSVCATENQGCIKDKAKHDEIQPVLSGSSHSIVTEESTPVLTATNSTVVDRSAFPSQRKSIQYTDPLPKLKAKNSPSKNIPTAGKRKLSLSNELNQDSPKKMRPSPTDGNHKRLSSSSNKHTKPNTLTVLKDQTVSSVTGKQPITPVSVETAKSLLLPSSSATNIQNVNQMSSPNCRAEFMPELGKTLKSSNNNNNDSLVSNKNTSDKTVSTVPSSVVNTYSYVNMHSPSTSRQVDVSSDCYSNRTGKWGGQRERVSHYTNLPPSQVRKRHCDDPGSKKAKLN